MTNRLAILLLHGMGDIKQVEFQARVDELKKDLNKQLNGKGGDDADLPITFKPVFYQNILQHNQNELYDMLNRHELDWKMLRKFLMFSISDAASLEHGADKKNSVYTQVQARIFDALLEVSNAGAEQVLIIAHSLGGQIISNYIWDSQLSNPVQGIWQDPPGFDSDAVEAFVRLKTLQCLMTTGCNIPLFVAGHDNIRAINTKDPAFEWHNFYDEDDVLGWPLKPMGGKFTAGAHGIAYDEAVTEDHPMNAAGSLWSWATKGWNPISHGGYWGDGEFLDVLSVKVREIMGSLD